MKVVGNPMWKLHTKMKRLIAILSNWSKKEYEDIFVKVKHYEKVVRSAEELSLQDKKKEIHFGTCSIS